jgi:pimeloyl-ACP methyl ester carboxylesterase
MQPLLLLHGAIGSLDQLLPLKHELSSEFDVYCFNFPGHGGDIPVESLSIADFAKATTEFIEKHQLKNPLVFGYSMGGYVAVYLESIYPGTFQRIITLGTKYEWSEEIAAKEIKMLRPDIIEQKVPAFAQQLADRHGALEWKNLLYKTATMLVELGSHPLLSDSVLQKINCPTLLLLGEKDNMVSLEETQNAAHASVSGQYEILPNTPHPIEQVDVKLLAAKIKSFFTH